MKVANKLPQPVDDNTFRPETLCDNLTQNALAVDANIKITRQNVSDFKGYISISDRKQ